MAASTICCAVIGVGPLVDLHLDRPGRLAGLCQGEVAHVIAATADELALLLLAALRPIYEAESARALCRDAHLQARDRALAAVGQPTRPVDGAG